MSQSRHCRRALPALALLLAAGGASAEKLVMPNGMGGVPDIGSIPCSLFIDMIRVAPLGTRHSLITWSAGYLESVTGKPLQETVNAADRTGPAWTYQRLGDELEGFCRATPTAMTRDSVLALAGKLGVNRP
ncbi:MAG: hypothetical protein J0M16_01755 [Gammaproteobacteria bacterium]|nr:hypothetical protein [Gammaproteobacteria bacterium]